MNQKLGKDALFAIVAENLGADKAQLRIAAENGPMFAVQYDKVEKKLFGLRKKRRIRCASSTRRASYACRKTMHGCDSPA